MRPKIGRKQTACTSTRALAEMSSRYRILGVMRRIQVFVIFLVVSVAGYEAANYFIQTDSLRPCTKWVRVRLDVGGFGYVCARNPIFSVQTPDAQDTIRAIVDLDQRVKLLETEIADLKQNL